MSVKIITDPDYDIRGEAIKQASVEINAGKPFIFISIGEDEISMINGGASFPMLVRTIEVLKKAAIRWMLEMGGHIT